MRWISTLLATNNTPYGKLDDEAQETIRYCMRRMDDDNSNESWLVRLDGNAWVPVPYWHHSAYTHVVYRVKEQYTGATQ